MSEKLPKGYECKACGEHNAFSAWVYAHWDFELVHICKCGQRHIIECGEARKVRDWWQA